MVAQTNCGFSKSVYFLRYETSKADAKFNMLHSSAFGLPSHSLSLFTAAN